MGNSKHLMLYISQIKQVVNYIKRYYVESLYLKINDSFSPFLGAKENVFRSIQSISNCNAGFISKAIDSFWSIPINF